jgi:hypothetical protein
MEVKFNWLYWYYCNKQYVLFLAVEEGEKDSSIKEVKGDENDGGNNQFLIILKS